MRKSLFVMIVMLLSAWTSAEIRAAIIGSEVKGGTFYLYSSGSRMFLNTTVNGPILNDYTKAQPATLIDNGDNTFLITGVTDRYLKLGTWNGQYLWCDGAAGDTKWSFELCSDKEGNAYHIYATEGNYTEPALEGTWYLSGSNATNNYDESDIYFLMDEQQYADYCETLIIQKLREELLELLLKADDLGLNTDDAWDVYDNEEATREELETAIATLKRLINADLAEGTDCTFLLVNADFTAGIDGWTVRYGEVKTGGNAVNPCAEAWQSNFDLCQQVEHVPNGIYQLDLSAFSRHGDHIQSWEERETPLELGFAYIDASETSVADYSRGATQDATIYEHPDQPVDGYYVPNSLDEASRGFNAGLYQNTVYGIVTDSVLRIGIKAQNMESNCWVVWDNFRLTYQAKNAAVLDKALETFIKLFVRYGDCVFSQTTRESLAGALRVAQSATTTDEKYNAYVSLQERKTAADTSIELYSRLFSTYERLTDEYSIYSSFCSQETAKIAILLIEDILKKYEACSYADSEVEGVIEEAEKMIMMLRTPADIAEASSDNPVNCTAFITNPTFQNNDNSGWNCLPQAGRAQMVEAAEYWNCNFEMNQTLKYIPNGIYQLSVSAFYRNGWATEANFAAYLDGKNPVNAFLYAESLNERASTPFVSYWDGGSSEPLGGNENVTTVGERTVYGPNDMASGVTYFESGYYNDNSLTVAVTDNTLKIGIYKDVLVSEDWTMFDDFRLTYCGAADQSAIDCITSVSTDMEAYYDLLGRRVKPLNKGIYIHKGKKIVIK